MYSLQFETAVCMIDVGYFVLKLRISNDLQTLFVQFVVICWNLVRVDFNNMFQG